MRYLWAHISSVIGQYNGSIPLSHFLKHYYRQHPKLGSRDRKLLSEMAYCWYRCGRALPDSLALEDRMKACLLLCDTAQALSLSLLPEHWQHKAELNTGQRIGLLAESGIGFDLHRLIPFTPSLSEGITTGDWLQSMLRQPRLFIRVREDRQRIEKILDENGIAYSAVFGDCLSLPNGAPVDKLLPPEAYTVQDASSQSTGAWFRPKAGEHWWDCCAGAGGKSLLLADQIPSVRLTVSDKRASILNNLSERFRLYGLKAPEQLLADVSAAEELKQKLGHRHFDHIISDVPCTGAGTWARTPEQLYFFDERQIAQFAALQKTIAANAARYLKDGGRLVYITCSVFARENEEVVQHLQQRHGMKLLESRLLNGIPIMADSMYVAVLTK